MKKSFGAVVIPFTHLISLHISNASHVISLAVFSLPNIHPSVICWYSCCAVLPPSAISYLPLQQLPLSSLHVSIPPPCFLLLSFPSMLPSFIFSAGLLPMSFPPPLLTSLSTLCIALCPQFLFQVNIESLGDMLSSLVLQNTQRQEQKQNKST